jgi:hypothetical protein
MRGLTCAVGVGLVLSGCASVPNSGPVSRADAPAEQELVVRYEPPGPVEGATPTEIVLGFLDAQQAYPSSVEKAAQFLTPEAAAAWHPSAQTVVYDLVRTHGGASTVELAARRVATVSGRGDYRAEPAPVLRSDQRLSLSLIRGEWRIENPPNAAYVSQSAFERYYRPYSLYFLDVTESVLVPEPVWLRSGTGLPGSLVRGLLAGPSPALGNVVSTAVPGEADKVSTVMSLGGVVEVRLPASATSLDQDQRDLLSAQLVWTLQQAPGVEGVRVLAGETPLSEEGELGVQPVGSWQSFDPRTPATRSQLLALRRGRLVAVSEDGVSEFSGGFGESAQGFGPFDVDLELNRITALSADGSRLLVGERAAEGQEPDTDTWYLGNDLLGPSWDRYGQLWLVDRDGATSKVLVVDPEGAREIGQGVLDDSRIVSYALSPDGSRFAAVVRGRGPDRGEERADTPAPPQIVLGRIVRGPRADAVSVDRVERLVTAPGALGPPINLAWRSASELVVLASSDGGPPEPYTVRIDGSQIAGGLLTGATPLDDASVTGLASSGDPADPVYIATRDGRVLSQDDAGRWAAVPSAPLRYPNFPG